MSSPAHVVPGGGLRAGLPAVMVAVAAWGVTGIIIKSIDMGSVAVVFWRFLLYAVLLTVVMRVRGRRPIRRILVGSLGGGVLLTADVAFFFTAVQLTSIVNATTIGALQPVVIAVYATRFLGERIQPREYAAATLAIAGVVVIVTRSSGNPEWSLGGDLAAVGALLAWSGYFIAAKRISGRLSPLEFTVGSGWWVAVFSFPLGLLVGQDMSVPPTAEILPLLALLLAGGVLGHSLMNWGIPRLPLWLSSTMTLLIPVFASIAAWIVLDEALDAWQVAAMAVVLLSLAVVVLAQSRPAGAADEPAVVESTA